MDCESVSQVMDAWAGVFAVMDTALFQQVPEGLIDGTVVQATGPLVEQERGIGRVWRFVQPWKHRSSRILNS